MLFYETAACLHGRMTPFKGKYFGSLFLHYKPADKNVWDFTSDDVINNVPPHWSDGVVQDLRTDRWQGAVRNTNHHALK